MLELVNLPAFTVVGISYVGKNENQEITQVWGVFNEREGEIENAIHDGAYGVCQMMPNLPEGAFEYVAGLKVEKVTMLPQGMVAREIPPQQYAVFTHIGALEKLPDTFHNIYHTWLPKSGYEHATGPDFEYYNHEFTDFKPDSQFYIYIPVRQQA